MRIIKSELVPEYLRDLLVNYHDVVLAEGKLPQSMAMHRVCKCVELDVKLQVKLLLNYRADDFADAGSQDQNFIILARWTVSTDCLNLRHSRHFFNDCEHLDIEVEIPRQMSLEDKNRVYLELATNLVERIDEFKVCVECRKLYLDKRVKEPSEMYCLQCMYDLVFFFKDTDCVICRECITKDTQTFTLTCAHTFHSHCILKHFILSKKRECPLCRELDQS